MEIIKKYELFRESKVEFQALIKVPELKSISDVPKRSFINKTENRELTENECKIVDEYISKFESVFLIPNEVIIDRLLDITDMDLNISVNRLIEVDETNRTDFDARKEIKDLNSLIVLKTWYDSFTNKTVIPSQNVLISKKDTYSKQPFDNRFIYKILTTQMLPFFEGYADCDVFVNHGGEYQVTMTIKYPKTVIS